MSVAYISSDKCMLHEMTEGHPEQPARLQAIREQLIKSGVYDKLHHYAAKPATRKQIEQVHDPLYVKAIHEKSPQEGLRHLNSDTAMNPFTLDAALYAAGAAIEGVDLVMSGEHKHVFCAVRPPGHHAEKKKVMGFCFFNNIAVGTAHALKNYDLQRVAIIDFDVHHGNGTENIFSDESRVLFCSSFQHPFYPYTRHETENDSIINIPLPAGTTGDSFRQAVRKHWLPRLHKFKPQLVMISAGFDAHVEDDMANMRLEVSDYQWITQQLVDMADRYAKGRIVSSLEGGYNLNALAHSVQAHIEVLNNV